MAGMVDTRAVRQQATRDRIVAAAWDLAARDTLAGWTLRDLAAAVGMRAPSLYTHFEGKDAIHDAMFAQGWRQLVDELADVPDDGPPEQVLLAGATAFFDFCTASIPRYQLLFTHVLGDWQPSPEAYTESQRAYAHMVDHLAAAGVTDAAAVDLWTALVGGLVAQQIANDRGGHRWRRLLPDAVAMFRTSTTDPSTSRWRSTP